MSSYISIPYIANKLLTVAMYKLRYKISIFKSVANANIKGYYYVRYSHFICDWVREN